MFTEYLDMLCMSIYKDGRGEVSVNPVMLHDLQQRRGAFLLEIPELQIEAGSVVGLVGRNGAGKSTLFELLAGLEQPQKGEVRVLGRDPWREPVAVRQKVAWMTPNQPVFPLRVDRLLQSVSRFYPTWDPALANRLVQRFGVPLGKQATELSLGEGVRLRLVLALAWHPQLVLLDEPGVGLDVPSRRAMLAEILQIVQDPGRTVIFSSHQVDDVERLADRVILLDQGRILADGPTETVTGGSMSLEELLAGRAP